MPHHSRAAAHRRQSPSTHATRGMDLGSCGLRVGLAAVPKSGLMDDTLLQASHTFQGFRHVPMALLVQSCCQCRLHKRGKNPSTCARHLQDLESYRCALEHACMLTVLRTSAWLLGRQVRRRLQAPKAPAMRGGCHIFATATGARLRVEVCAPQVSQRHTLRDRLCRTVMHHNERVR